MDDEGSRNLRMAERIGATEVRYNHDLEGSGAAHARAAVHGPTNFHFACGNTRFVAIDGGSGQIGELGDTTPPDTPARASRRCGSSTTRSQRRPSRTAWC